MRNDFCENYLMHADRANHKYVAKVKLASGKYYYFYDLAKYQRYLRGSKPKDMPATANNAKKNPNENKVSATTKSVLSNDKVVQNLVNKKTEGATIEEKTKHLKSYMKNGEEKISDILNKNTSSAASSAEDSTSSKKSSKGGSGSSKSDSKKSIGGKGAKSSKSGSSKEKTAKEKSSGSGSKAAKEKTVKEKTSKEKQTSNAPMTMDKLQSTYGKKDEEVSKFSGSASDFKNDMLSKYKDGSFGYLSAGDTVYKWEIDGNNVILIDYKTDKKVSFDEYLKDANAFKSFQTNTKKKK